MKATFLVLALLVAVVPAAPAAAADSSDCGSSIVFASGWPTAAPPGTHRLSAVFSDDRPQCDAANWHWSFQKNGVHYSSWPNLGSVSQQDDDYVVEADVVLEAATWTVTVTLTENCCGPGGTAVSGTGTWTIVVQSGTPQPGPRPPACNDGRDNDGDGSIDTADPGCDASSDASERSAAVCDDGIDNDGDGAIDYPHDAGCQSSADPNEGDSSLPPVPIQVPPTGASQTVPAQSTPPVPSKTVSTPAVATPATCALSPCTSPTTVGGNTVTTPGIPSQTLTTPPATVPYTCVPLVVCVGPFTIPEQTVGPTPPVPSQSFTLPSHTLAPVCTSAPLVCLPSTVLVPSQTVTTPSQPSIPLTPEIAVSVTSTGLDGRIDPHGNVGTIGPIIVEVPTPFGPVPVTLCPETCPSPAPADATLQGSVTVTLAIGAETFSETVSVTV